MLCCVLSFLHALFKKMQQASLVAQMVKNPPAMQETWFYPWFKKMPWRRKWQPTPIFLPGEFYGQRSRAGYSPWGCRESDMTGLNNNNTQRKPVWLEWIE